VISSENLHAWRGTNLSAIESKIKPLNASTFPAIEHEQENDGRSASERCYHEMKCGSKRLGNCTANLGFGSKAESVRYGLY